MENFNFVFVFVLKGLFLCWFVFVLVKCVFAH